MGNDIYNEQKKVEQLYLQWNIKVEQWYLQWPWRLNDDIYRIWILNLPPPHTHFNDPPYSTLINITFLWYLRMSWVEKGFATKGAHQSHS